MSKATSDTIIRTHGLSTRRRYLALRSTEDLRNRVIPEYSGFPPMLTHLKYPLTYVISMSEAFK